MSSLIPYTDARALLLDAELVPAANVHFANEPFSEPQPPTPWLAFDAFSHNLGMIDLGANAYREEGTVTIQCVAPALTGTDTLRDLAKQITNIYRGLGPRNPMYLNASISEAIASEDGMWFVIIVSIDFQYEDHAAT